MEKLLQKIMLKAYEVNKNTKHAVFCEFCGHVNWFQVCVYLNGWKENLNPDIKIGIYIDEKYAETELQHMLDKLEALEG